ncbi:hypothetical protein PENANT_c019G08061 [Penicillium antarcticum]|uniref:Uncharacterized protein n=1 Tax=Penicillium antarcticum TaxID=416450 RepID=A0A1V6Q0R4_9EURO|nr:hypothetical protein PENANT_c019G08061 [Penicillium antarcticum]
MAADSPSSLGKDGSSDKYIAFDTPDSSVLPKKMRELGINIGSCGV